MARPMKFRAWHCADRRWIETDRFFVMGDGELGSYGSYDDTGGFDSEVVLMQFTGLLDKNGKEIYEGDVVRYGEEGMHCEVKYDSTLAQWKWADWRFNRTDLPKLTVIGNIYENPELLKV